MPSFIAAVFHHWGVAAILHIHYENKFHIYISLEMSKPILMPNLYHNIAFSTQNKKANFCPRQIDMSVLYKHKVDIAF